MFDKPIKFDEIIAPLTRDQFLANYWLQKFLHVRGPKGRFTPLLSWEALNVILEWHTPSQPRVRLFQEGKLLDARRYVDGQVGSLQINVGGLVTALSQGASMVVDAVQDVAPPVRQLLQAIEDALEGKAIANLYAGWRQQYGFDLHWDPHEVVVLQLSGRKHWKVYGPTRPYPLDNDIEYPPQPGGAPVFDGVLDDGDMLYVPRGWWHMAIPLDEPCLHLSIGIELLTGADFLQWMTRRMLGHSEVRQNLPRRSGQRDYFARLLQLLESSAADDPVGQFVQERSSLRRAHPPVRLPTAPLEQLQPISRATSFRLASLNHLFIELVPGERMAKFNVAGLDYSFAAELIPAFQKLSGQKDVTLEVLCAGIQNQQLVTMLVAALDKLSQAGVVLKKPGGGS